MYGNNINKHFKVLLHLFFQHTQKQRRICLQNQSCCDLIPYIDFFWRMGELILGLSIRYYFQGSERGTNHSPFHILEFIYPCEYSVILSKYQCPSYSVICTSSLRFWRLVTMAGPVARDVSLSSGGGDQRPDNSCSCQLMSEVQGKYVKKEFGKWGEDKEMWMEQRGSLREGRRQTDEGKKGWGGSGMETKRKEGS